jgi:hypothetical protein
MVNYPDKFDDTIPTFQSFLTKNHWPFEILWINEFKEQTFYNLWNWITIKKISNSELEREYLFAKNNFGAAAVAIGIYKDQTIAVLDVPKNDADAQNKLIGPKNMKFSVPSKKRFYNYLRFST